MWQWLGSLKISCDFAVLGKVQVQGEVNGTSSLCMSPRNGCHLFEADNVKIQAHQSVRYVFCRGVIWEAALMAFSDFG
jgi:hypothetical protein